MNRVVSISGIYQGNKDSKMHYLFFYSNTRSVGIKHHISILLLLFSIIIVHIVFALNTHTSLFILNHKHNMMSKKTRRGVYTSINERSQVDIRFINVSRFLCRSPIYKAKRPLDLFLIKCQT